MPLVVQSKEETESMPDRTWTEYECPCGEFFYSDIPYQVMYCLECGAAVPRPDSVQGGE